MSDEAAAMTRIRGATGGYLTRLFLAAAIAAGTLAASACQGVVVSSGGAGKPSHAARHSPAGRHERGPSASGLRMVHDPGQVTGTITGRCHSADHGRLPDRHCTPGAVDPAVTQANIASTICVSGYTHTVRPAEAKTEAFKFHQAYPAYGLADGVTSELDHLVPLELGGANDAANLWPEVGTIPNPKDEVERALNRAVCDGRVGLAAAKRAVARDWETAEARLGL